MTSLSVINYSLMPLYIINVIEYSSLFVSQSLQNTRKHSSLVTCLCQLGSNFFTAPMLIGDFPSHFPHREATSSNDDITSHHTMFCSHRPFMEPHNLPRNRQGRQKLEDTTHVRTHTQHKARQICKSKFEHTTHIYTTHTHMHTHHTHTHTHTHTTHTHRHGCPINMTHTPVQ